MLLAWLWGELHNVDDCKINAVSGRVAIARYSRLSTADWFSHWLKHSSPSVAFTRFVLEVATSFLCKLAAQPTYCLWTTFILRKWCRFPKPLISKLLGEWLLYFCELTLVLWSHHNVVNVDTKEEWLSTWCSDRCMDHSQLAQNWSLSDACQEQYSSRVATAWDCTDSSSVNKLSASCPWQQNLLVASYETSSSSLPFRKAVVTSTWCSWRPSIASHGQCNDSTDRLQPYHGAWCCRSCFYHHWSL